MQITEIIYFAQNIQKAKIMNQIVSKEGPNFKGEAAKMPSNAKFMV